MTNNITYTKHMDTEELTIEQLVGDITGTMIKSMNSVLQPLVCKINNNTKRDMVIQDWLKQLPEYQQLVSENKRLLEENLSYKQSDNITMHIKEKNTSVQSHEYVNHNDSLRSSFLEWRERFSTYIESVTTTNTTLIMLKQDYDELFYKVFNVSDSSTSSKVMVSTQTDCDTVLVSEPEPASEEEEEAESEPDAESEPEEESDAETEKVVELENKMTAHETEMTEIENEWNGINDKYKEPEPIAVQEEEQEEEMFVVEMEDEDGNIVEYLTDDDQNGSIFVLEDDDGVGKKIGNFVNGEPELFA